MSKNVFPEPIEDDGFEDVWNTCDNHTPQDAHDVIDQGKVKGANARGASIKKEKGLKERKKWQPKFLEKMSKRDKRKGSMARSMTSWVVDIELKRLCY